MYYHLFKNKEGKIYLQVCLVMHNVYLERHRRNGFHWLPPHEGIASPFWTWNHMNVVPIQRTITLP